MATMDDPTRTSVSIYYYTIYLFTDTYNLGAFSIIQCLNDAVQRELHG